MPKINRDNKFVTNIIPENLLETIEQLQTEKAALKRELFKQKRKPTGNIGYMILFFGAIILFLSIVFAANVPAFIGISLTFWGALILFIKPTRYVKANLLETMTLPTFTNISRIITSMNYTGNGIYLPPQYSKESRGGIVFIPSKNETTIPAIKETREKLFLEKPRGICLSPSGLDLTNMFEDELGIVFTESKMENLEDDLQKLFIEGLEITDTFEILNQENNIHIIMSKSIYNNFCRNSRMLNKNDCKSFACPLCSSIACALTRVTGKPVIINNISISTDDDTMQIDYQVLGTLEKASRPYEQISRRKVAPARAYPFPNLFVLIPAVIGSILLAFIGWLIWYDLMLWGKDLTLILFGSRTGEAISLGIGMRLIHYIILASAFFIATIITFLRKRQLKEIEI
jgi:hypothetical protein